MMKLFGDVKLKIMGQGKNDFSEENFTAGKLQIVRCDGSKVEFDVWEVLHKDLVAIDEFGNEIDC